MRFIRVRAAAMMTPHSFHAIHAGANSFAQSQHTLSIYLHFPWCLQKCHYCDFYSLGLLDTLRSTHLNQSARRSYINALQLELQQRLQAASSFRNFQEVTSIYIGGGTPSLLTADEIAYILAQLRAEFTVGADCEITLEANPENINADYLQSIAQAGINRINVGIQTFQPQILNDMHRFYDCDAYANVLQLLQASPLSRNFGLDLIYGFPTQTKADFYSDLQRVLCVKPTHLSLYSLTVESNTVYGQLARHSPPRMAPPRFELQDEIWAELNSYLQRENMRQYEVSNYARNGFWSRHNLRYWLYMPYLGLGPGRAWL